MAGADRIWPMHRVAADSKSASSLRILPQLLCEFLLSAQHLAQGVECSVQCFDLYVFRDSVIIKLNQTETKLPLFVDK